MKRQKLNKRKTLQTRWKWQQDAVVIFCYRKQDCSPAESSAIMEEVRALEALLKQVKEFHSSNVHFGIFCNNNMRRNHTFLSYPYPGEASGYRQTAPSGGGPQTEELSAAGQRATALGGISAGAPPPGGSCCRCGFSRYAAGATPRSLAGDGGAEEQVKMRRYTQ